MEFKMLTTGAAMKSSVSSFAAPRKQGFQFGIGRLS